MSRTRTSVSLSAKRDTAREASKNSHKPEAPFLRQAAERTELQIEDVREQFLMTRQAAVDFVDDPDWPCMVHPFSSPDEDCDACFARNA